MSCFRETRGPAIDGRRKSCAPCAILLLISLAAALLAAVAGCSKSRETFRRQADQEVYQAIGERNGDPRWSEPRYGIEQDPRSRFFDPSDPDRSPMPPDDPAAHRYMHCVDGKTGWKHWHANGDRSELENPQWRARLVDYVTFSEEGAVKLDVPTAVRLAYVHSPNHQRQLETLYLSALDVTAERFALDTQFFGGYDARYAHNGKLIPAGLGYSPLLKRFVVTPPFEGAGLENNRLTVGRPFAGDPALQARRRFARAGELLVGFANSFVFEFTGGDANLAASLANFSFIQPLLRGAGKDVALEQLTFVERSLLASLRSYRRFRQGFYTQVAIGELGVEGTARQNRATTLTSFSGQGGVGGYLGLLEQLQRIRNSEDNLDLQVRTLARLEALLEVGVIDLVQVDQFRQNVENERSGLLQLENAFELALDRYKTQTLGLPPDLPIELDDRLLEPFQLIPREAVVIQDDVLALQRAAGALPEDAAVAQIAELLARAELQVQAAAEQFSAGEADLEQLESATQSRRERMNPQQATEFEGDLDRLQKRLADLQREYAEAETQLAELRAKLAEDTRAETLRGLIAWVARFLRIVERLALVPARARLEAIGVEDVALRPEAAFRIALTNRLDFMNGRAALVDSWRLIQVNADALQSVLNLTASGDLRTARNNPVSFRAPTGTFRAGLEFDAPFTRLLERNAYRESLIQFQQDRRAYVQSEDALHLGLRALLRQIDLLSETLEIQRRAVRIAIRRVDLTQAQLAAPQPLPRPGQPIAPNPTTAINLLSAQSSLRDSQNALLNAWLNYYAARLRLYRELGIMELDVEFSPERCGRRAVRRGDCGPGRWSCIDWALGAWRCGRPGAAVDPSRDPRPARSDSRPARAAGER